MILSSVFRDHPADLGEGGFRTTLPGPNVERSMPSGAIREVGELASGHSQEVNILALRLRTGIGGWRAMPDSKYIYNKIDISAGVQVRGMGVRHARVHVLSPGSSFNWIWTKQVKMENCEQPRREGLAKDCTGMSEAL